MSRAEIRRAKREEQKKTTVFTMTAEELAKYKRQAYEEVRKELLANNEKMASEMRMMMLAIPTNVLIEYYWPKSAEKKIPGFCDDCLALFEAWMDGTVDARQMIETTEKYGKVKLITDDSSVLKTIERAEKRGLK